VAGRPLVILKTGNSFPELVQRAGDFEEWIANGLATPPERVTVCDARRDELPSPAGTAGVVITGSPAMLTNDEPWMLAAEAWVRELAGASVPVLGICFGHQLLARALGGRVDWSDDGREIGTTRVTLTPAGRHDPLLGGLGPSFVAQSSHAQRVTELPPRAEELARSERQPLAAFRLGTTWGVQFHPEFSAEIMRAYVDRHAEAMRAEGDDPGAVRRTVTDSPAGAILARFAEHALGADGPAR